MIETFTNDGFNISYKTQGSGKDIIFLHGFPSTMSMWDSLVDELIDNNFRVTTIEQRGYPLSSNLKMDVSDFTLDKLSEDIEILIRTLDLSHDLTLVGHDWGTVVAWATLKRNNVSIKNYISICGGTLFPGSDVYKSLTYNDGEHYITSFQNATEAAEILNRDIKNTIYGAYRVKNQNVNHSLSLKALFNDFNHIEYAITEELLCNIASEFSDNGLYGPVAWYANIDQNIQLSSKWKHNEVTQKVSFIFGEDDKAVLLTEKMKDRLNKEAKFVTIKEVSGAGHWLPYTHRESVLNEIYSINKDY